MWERAIRLGIAIAVLGAACGGKSVAPSGSGSAGAAPSEPDAPNYNGVAGGAPSEPDAPNYGACERDSDCMVEPAACCGVCDDNTLTPSKFIAVNRKYADHLFCQDDPASCKPCGFPVDQRRFIVGECRQGLCQAVHLLRSKGTRCQADEDCRLRYGFACCEPCTFSDVFATNQSNDFLSLVCAEGQTCSACVPPPIEHVSPYCTDEGYCVASPWLTP